MGCINSISLLLRSSPLKTKTSEQNIYNETYMLSAQFAARRGEDFPPYLQPSGNAISWKKVISVPPSGNNICRESAENILTVIPASAHYMTIVGCNIHDFQRAVDTSVISTSYLNRHELLLTGSSIKIKNTLKIRSSTGKN